MSAVSWARVSAAMGIPFVVGFVLLGVLSGNSPDYKSSDSKILDWYASHGHRVSDIAGIFVLAISAAFFLWFLGHLRDTLRAAEGAGRVDSWDAAQPVAALVERSRGADLVVVGSRGVHGLRALGSVSERVAHRANCSILVVHDG